MFSVPTGKTSDMTWLNDVHGSVGGSGSRYYRGTSESQEEREARLAQRQREQEEARICREREEERNKVRAKMDRERGMYASSILYIVTDWFIVEQKEAEERQKAKHKSKKAAAKNKKKHAEDVLRNQKQQAQALRSSVFAAARANDETTVKKGIWEDGVDASGGEIKIGCEDFVPHPVIDKQETLLHIAAMKGNADLVEWLDVHSKEVHFDAYTPV